jgi:hypothetical protein
MTLPTTDTYTILIEPFIFTYPYTNDIASITGSMTLQLFQDQTGTLSLNGPAFPASTLLGQVADLSYDGTAGQQVSMSVSNSTYGLNTNVNVLNPAGSYMGYFGFPLGSGDSGAFSLPSTGTYILQAGGSAAGSADVTLYDATPMTGSITVNGYAVSLNTNPGQPLELSFNGTQGQQLLVGTSSSTYGSVSYTVFEPSGYSLASGWLTGAGGSDSVPPLPSTGTYTLELIGDPGAGSASIQLSSTTAQNLTTTFGGALTVTLNGQPINITFTGNEGQWVEMTESNSTLSACVTASLLDPAGGAIWPPGEFCLTTRSEIYYMDAQELPTTGTYTISLNPPTGATGSVEIQLYNATPTTGPITPNGPPVTAWMTAPSQNFMYTFSGTEGERAGVAITDFEYPFCYQTVSLYAPDGEQLDQRVLDYYLSEVSYPGGTATMTDVLPSNSTPTSPYWLYVDDSGCSWGSAQIQLYSSPMQTGTIGINGPPVTAVSTVPGQQTQLTVTPNLSQNQSVSLQTSNSTYLDCDPHWTDVDGFAVLTDPNGNPVDEADLCESPSFGPVTLSTGGTYTITVEPDGAPGSVDLTLTSP